MANSDFKQRLTRYYSRYTVCFILFLVSLSILEKEGFPRVWIGYLFIFSPIVLYAGIGVISRTSDVSEYYVAGRRVPAFFFGLVFAVVWFLVVCFFCLVGGLFLFGFVGLVF